jgi:hypothetical protein
MSGAILVLLRELGRDELAPMPFSSWVETAGDAITAPTTESEAPATRGAGDGMEIHLVELLRHTGCEAVPPTMDWRRYQSDDLLLLSLRSSREIAVTEHLRNRAPADTASTPGLMGSCGSTMVKG